MLGAVHKCQNFHECTNNTVSETPPPKRVHINKCMVCTLVKMLTFMDSPLKVSK